MEGIGDKPVIGAFTDINGNDIFEIVYRNNDTTRTVITITTAGEIRGFRAGIYYIGSSYLLTEETKDIYFELAKTELKNRLNVSLPDGIGFKIARLDPTMMTLGVSDGNRRTETPNGFSVSFNNLNLEQGTGSVSRAAIYLTGDVSAVKKAIFLFEELSAAKFETELGMSIPNGYEVSTVYLSFYLNEVSINLTWTDSSHQSDVSYLSSMNSVDLLNTTANFPGMGMCINYSNYTGHQKFTPSQIDKMIKAARDFTDRIKLRTSAVTDTQNFEYCGYEGLVITFSPEPPFEMNTEVYVSDDGEILSYTTNPTSPRSVPLDISPR